MIESGMITSSFSLVEEMTIVSENTKRVDGENKYNVDNKVKFHERMLSDSPEVRSVVVLRVNALDSQATRSLEQLRDDVFYDEVNVSTQMNACSYGWTRIEPYDGTTETDYEVDRGAVDIEVDTTVADKSRKEIETAVLAQFAIELGGRDQFDHIMIVLVSHHCRDSLPVLLLSFSNQ